MKTPHPVTFPPVRDWLAWVGARLGLAGVAGLCLLLLALYALLERAPDLRARAAEATQDASRLNARPPAAAPVVTVRDWRAELPRDKASFARLAKLFRSAERGGLTIAEARYRALGDPLSGINRLTLVLPLRGAYPAVRGFIREALNQDAALALDGLRLTRTGMAQADVEAELRFTFYEEGRATARPASAAPVRATP